jgi:hypothetical protein
VTITLTITLTVHLLNNTYCETITHYTLCLTNTYCANDAEENFTELGAHGVEIFG